MDIFLVGGAVRDELLNLDIIDRDWVVVGATVDDMLGLGYQQVGKDFPVFLHPQSKEEYALARKERKQGSGYHGFVCDTSPTVSLEDDLLRRDLTINAIAKNAAGDIFDPFNGQKDIQDKKLRHVSQAFTEDPLRILRVARFSARFAHLGFSIAEETKTLMKRMSTEDELNTIAHERIWRETEKALLTEQPWIYFDVLRDCGALAILFPELNALFGIPQTAIHHPEIDTGIHTLMVLEQAAKLSTSVAVRFAALTHDFGKAATDKAAWPRHIGHEQLGRPLVKQCCQRLGTSKEITLLAEKVCLYHLHAHRAFELKASTIHKLFKSLDVYRKPNLLKSFLLACEADSKGRLGFTHKSYPQANYLTDCFQAAVHINISDINAEGLKGPKIGEAIEQKRIDAIAAIKHNHK